MKSSSNTKGQIIRVTVPCNSSRNTSSTFGNMLMQLATLATSCDKLQGNVAVLLGIKIDPKKFI